VAFTGERQKQGSAEAVPGKDRAGIALFLTSIKSRRKNICQEIKNLPFLDVLCDWKRMANRRGPHGMYSRASIGLQTPTRRARDPGPYRYRADQADAHEIPGGCSEDIVNLLTGMKYIDERERDTKQSLVRSLQGEGANA
jgi:hypothetical protein